MHIILTRTYSNKDVTHGVLSCDGDDDFHVLTLERARPWNEQLTYRNRCLPPGIYPLEISRKVLSFRGTTLAAPWIRLSRVKGYPNAFFSTDHEGLPQAGMILLGTQHQQFSITTDSDHVTRHIALLARRLYDPVTGIEREPVTLLIRDSPDLIFEDTSQRDQERQQQLEEELRLKAEAEKAFG